MRFTKEQIETKVFDNFTHEQKGYIILDLESKEKQTEMPFNILTHNNLLILEHLKRISFLQDPVDL